MLNKRDLNSLPIYMLSVSQARERMDDYLMEHQVKEDVKLVKNIVIPRIWGRMDARVYEPGSDSDGKALIFFHGGGWTLNSVETYDGLCRALANRTGRVVISPEFRLAPEHKFPAAVEDAVSTVQWVYDNAESLGVMGNKLAVAGDSSGAAMATVAAMYFRDRGGVPVEKQVLLYPVTDYYMPGTESYQTYGTGYMIDRNFLIWGWNHYIQSTDDLSNPYLCPLRAEDLSNMPEALIITAEKDVVRDEGELYGEKMRECGCKVKVHRYDGAMHGFLMNTKLRLSRKVLDEVGEFCRAGLV